MRQGKGPVWIVAGGAVIVTLIAVLFVAGRTADRHREREVRAERQASTELALAAQVQRHVIDLETGVRGFAITGRPRYLVPWAAARRKLPRELGRLRALTSEAQAQQHAATGLAAAIEDYISGYSVPFVATQPAMSPRRLRSELQRGKRIMDGLRPRFDAFTRAVTSERRRSQAARDAQAARAKAIASVALGLALVALIGLLLLLRRFIRNLNASRLRAETAHRLLDAGFEQSAVGMATGDVEQPLKRVNSRLAAITGHSRAELERDGLTRLLPAAAAARLQERLDLLWRGRIESVHEDLQARHRDGGQLCLSVSVSCSRTRIGSPIELLFQVQDATERWRAEAELERSILATTEARERYERLLDGIDEVVFEVDGDGCWALLSGAWERATGFGVADTIGRSYLDFLPPADRAEHAQAMLPLLSGAVDSVTFEHRFCTAAGEQRWAAVEAHRTPGGAGVSGLIRDVTDRRAAEQATRAYTESLAAVNEITRMLPAGGDARALVCEAAARASGATAVTLLEPRGDALVATAVYGWPDRDVQLPIAGRSATATAFHTREPLFVDHAPTSPVVDMSLAQNQVIGSLFAQPVIHGGKVVAVLNLVWSGRIGALSDQRAAVLGLFAAEAGAAIERADLLAKLEQAAHTDGLTGLINRRHWEELLPDELRRAERHGYRLTVALLDLDHFKRLNDTEGHQAGDRMLRAAAAAWRSAVRDVDLVARWGGEEFVVGLPGASLDEALVTVERLRAALPGTQTCSAGIAEWDGEESPEELLRRADGALYAAKEQGRDRALTAA